MTLLTSWTISNRGEYHLNHNFRAMDVVTWPKLNEYFGHKYSIGCYGVAHKIVLHSHPLTMVGYAFVYHCIGLVKRYVTQNS